MTPTMWQIAGFGIAMAVMIALAVFFLDDEDL